MTFDPHRFESLGANCEFGFLLQDRGNDETSLFKWAEVIGLEGLTRLIRNDFAGMFAYENVVPFNAQMVLDRDHWIAWHSKIQAEAADPTQPLSRMNSKFSTPEPERRELWEDQNGKLQHFVRKLREGLMCDERIFVYKPRVQDTVSENEIVALSDAMQTHGPNVLLAVTIAESPDQIGTVRVVRPGLLRGYVDRFAPGDAANAYSAEAWDAVCSKAQDLVWPPEAVPASPVANTPATTSQQGGLLARAASAARRMLAGRRG